MVMDWGTHDVSEAFYRMWMMCVLVCRELELTLWVMWRPCEVDVRCQVVEWRDQCWCDVFLALTCGISRKWGWLMRSCLRTGGGRWSALSGGVFCPGFCYQTVRVSVHTSPKIHRTSTDLLTRQHKKPPLITLHSRSGTAHPHRCPL